MEAYRDSYGRIHDKPVSQSNPFPCNNAFLFSGYAKVCGIQDVSDNIQECFTLSQTQFGFNRHPDGKQLPASSHDELVGMMMLWPKYKCRQAVTHYQSQMFQICNLDGFVPIPWTKLNPLQVVSNFWRLSHEGNPRKATPSYPYIWPIAFKHAPQHVYFYHRCAVLAPGIYLTVRFFMASLFTIWHGSNSGQVMLGFKLWKLSGQRNWVERVVAKLYSVQCDFEMEVRKSFPPDHPIIESFDLIKSPGDKPY